MTHEKLQRLEKKEQQLEQLIFSDRYVFHKNLQILEGKKIQVGTTHGLTIGTSTSEKLGFFSVSPVNQPDTVADPSTQANDLDSEARTAINALIDRLQELGLIA